MRRDSLLNWPRIFGLWKKKITGVWESSVRKKESFSGKENYQEQYKKDGYQIASVGRVRWEGTIPLMHGLCEVCELFEVRLPS